MSVAIEHLDGLESLQRNSLYGHMEMREKAIMDSCLQFTRHLWAGSVDGKIACIWGLIPPTLMSTQAYLWLYTTELVKDHTFLFVRYSQRAIEQMLEEYPTIVGVCEANNTRAIRWIKWLGGTFNEPVGRGIPFIILRKDNG